MVRLCLSSIKISKVRKGACPRSFISQENFVDIVAELGLEALSFKSTASRKKDEHIQNQKRTHSSTPGSHSPSFRERSSAARHEHSPSRSLRARSHVNSSARRAASRRESRLPIGRERRTDNVRASGFARRNHFHNHWPIRQNACGFHQRLVWRVACEWRLPHKRFAGHFH